jgi:hypothetical protein
MKSSPSCSVLIIASIVLVVTSVGRGAILAFDNASQAAYDDGWQSGDNGGSGFGPWSFSGAGTGGIGSSTANGDAQPPTGDIDSAGSRAWSLTHGASFSFIAVRPLLGNLAVGQHILFDADAVATVGPNGDAFHIELQNATGSRVDFYVDVFGAHLFDNTGAHIVHSATPEGFHIDFMLTGSDLYMASINVLGEAPTMFSGTLSGDTGSPIDRISLINAASLVGQDVFYANNLAVAPEPASPAFLVVGLCVAVGRRTAVGEAERRALTGADQRRRCRISSAPRAANWRTPRASHNSTHRRQTRCGRDRPSSLGR